ncbi:MAG: hypothetical protein IJU23_13270 [Proteobacteria bacterium]|nr:hypothetical protein [Pseudomonadota bacterium]
MDDRTKKKYERLARAMSSDSVMYMKDAILKGFEEDNFFEAIEENLEENKKAFLARTNEEAAATNILAVATNDVIIYPLGSQGKYPIF